MKGRLSVGKIAIPLLAAGLVVVVTSCSGLFPSTTTPVSAADRASQFVTDLNGGDYHTISLNFASPSPQGSVDASGYWNGSPFDSSNGPFQWTAGTTTDNASMPDVSGTATEIAGQIYGTASGATLDVQFYMTTDSNGDAVIRELIYSNSGSSGTGAQSIYSLNGGHVKRIF